MAVPNQIEKALSQQILSEQDQPEADQSEVKIGVVNPEAVMIETEDGGVEFDFSKEESQPTSENLAEDMDDDDLEEMWLERLINRERTYENAWAKNVKKNGLEI